MTINRVDTTRPEYSWIPFFEELAQRLHEDGWRDRQGEIVAELQRMRAEGVKVNSEVDRLTDFIDPFSIFAMIRRVGFPNALKVMNGYKSLFGVSADLPAEEPVNPKSNPVNSMLFPRDPAPTDVNHHWNLFDYVIETKSEDFDEITEGLMPLLNASQSVKQAEIPSVTGALYWIQPHRYLKTDTIDHFLGKGDYSNFGDSYLKRLSLLREHDVRPFPELNNEEWLARNGSVNNDIRRYPRTWLVWSGSGGSHADRFVEKGTIGIGWEMNIRDCTNRAELNDAFRAEYPDASRARRGAEVGSINRFVFEVAIGDYVLTPNDTDGFHVGVFAGDPTFDNHDGFGFPTRRTVSWDSRGPHARSALPGTFWRGTNPTVLEIRRAKRVAMLEFLEELGGFPNQAKAYTVDSMIDEGVFLERSAIHDMLALLRRKQNLILQGPPGTGKTFIAKRLAYALMGERADDRIASVQFHQSYSYEDFVGGFRPSINDDQQLIFKAEDGAFLRLCEKAREDTENDYVMLIDEINRGNLSRVFGELLMLIESDKREDRHAVDLQHRIAMSQKKDETVPKFYVPPNVYIIGTMNLADRSLTGMNVAMRRRFAFRDLKPQFESPRFREWIQDAGMPGYLQEHILKQLEALNAMIGEDASLGKQYAVGHSFFTPSRDGRGIDDWDAWYESVVEYEIRPLLEEYWFDQPDKADTEVGKLAKPQTDGTLESGEATDEDQD